MVVGVSGHTNSVVIFRALLSDPGSVVPGVELGPVTCQKEIHSQDHTSLGEVSLSFSTHTMEVSFCTPSPTSAHITPSDLRPLRCKKPDWLGEVWPSAIYSVGLSLWMSVAPAGASTGLV